MTSINSAFDALERSLRLRIKRTEEERDAHLATIAKQKRQMGDLGNRVGIAEQKAEQAERQARSLTVELTKARRRIAELESLGGHR